MRPKTIIRPIEDDYLKLIQRFPLRPVRSAAEYGQAMALLRKLLARADDEGLSDGESDYADVLSRLVREYDEQHSSILKDLAAGRRSPVEMLKYLMAEHGMNTIALGKLVGGSGQASMILRGKRELSKANIRTLAKYFSVSPALFL